MYVKEIIGANLCHLVKTTRFLCTPDLFLEQEVTTDNWARSPGITGIGDENERSCIGVLLLGDSRDSLIENWNEKKKREMD